MSSVDTKKNINKGISCRFEWHEDGKYCLCDLNKEIVVRFAPSPTGSVHVGNARAAIFNWLFAKHYNGTFLLRIEDTDLVRSKAEYTEIVLNSLNWLGLDWARPPVYQSHRMDIYTAIIEKLIDQGDAYFCQCKSEDLDLLREQAVTGGTNFTYPGTCRDKKISGKLGSMAVRLKIPNHGSWFQYDDLIKGNVVFPREQIDDYVIARTDGSPTYNFCVVIDDSSMGITHVIRGEDHISNTPKQLALYQILDLKTPKFAHLPMVLSPEGGRLSKRDGAVSVQDYIREGFLPQAMLNYLVRLGWSHGDQEIFSKEELVSFFTLEQVGKKGATFDRKKFEWLNAHYIRESSPQELKKAYQLIDKSKVVELEEFFGQATLDKLIELYASRAVTILQIFDPIKELINCPENLDLSLCEKWLDERSALALEKLSESIDGSFWPVSAKNLIEIAKEICDGLNIKLVSLAQPLRLAITGSIQSPGIFEIIELLDKKEVLERIKNLLRQI